MKYLIIGLGKSGISTANHLISKGNDVYIYDDIPKDKWPKIEKSKLFLDQKISDFNIIILSPGISYDHKLVKEANNHEIPIICDIELFYRQNKHNPKTKFVAITGTNGKSTVTALMTHILSQMGENAIACGNIGKPIFETEKPSSNNITYYIIEVSSFQADLCREFSPDIAIFLNLANDHLDRHGSMDGYFSAKMKIFRHIPSQGKAIIIGDDEYSKKAKNIAKEYYEFDNGDFCIVKEAIFGNPFLAGNHNLENSLNVYAALKMLGFNSKDFLKHFKSFKGLPHRMEYIGKCDRVTYINDSKATNADAAQKSLLAYNNIFWLAGGIAKSGGIEAIVPYTKNVKKAFLYGRDKERFAKSLSKANIPFEIFENLEQAFTKAKQSSDSNINETTILLSPAAASYDQFDNFEQRGNFFKKLINIVQH